jgi:1-acyl-sn-glycerol-3-phosphate acyltransferase
MNDAWSTRFLCRLVARIGHARTVSLVGLDAVHPANDPFILALNHSQRPEAVLLPTMLIHYRGGKLIHFVADWNMLFVPLVATLYRRSQVIVVGRKHVRPRFLNSLKPHMVDPTPVFDQALAALRRGSSVGLFPEGVMNRDPDRLLAGRIGTARLSLESGVPLLPAGIRFPHRHRAHRISDRDPMEVHIGKPLEPPRRPATAGAVREWHHTLMHELSRLSGKRWTR